MSTDYAAYKKLVEEQQQLLLVLLARLGLEMDYEIEVPIPDDDTPLALMFHAVKLVAENLAVVDKERDEFLKVVQKQSEAILELSTPVIPIWDDIVVLPLIGTVDTARAQQILDNLLEAVSKTQAQVAIIDITGVPVVDTKVAHHFLRAIEAARMLGAEAILTGVSPYNAQTLVKLGVDLTKITTRGSLKDGLDLALSMTKRAIVRAK